MEFANNFLRQLKNDSGQLLSAWMLAHGLKIIGIAVVAWLVSRFSRIFIERAIRQAVRSAPNLSANAERKREDTLIAIFDQALSVVVWIIAGLMILSELGIDTAPLIAGAGIVGVALGFGGQYLIKDLISGFFLILENQYRVGDVVCFGDTCGLVENVTLRTTVLRDLDGTVHHVPNGEVTTASNLTKGYSRVNIDIGIGYDSDLEKVEKVVNKVGLQLANDDKWKEDILKAPEFVRVTEFADSAIIIKILGDTKPIKQWEVAGELRKRLKISFDKNNIEIPFPQHDVHMKK